MGIFSRSEPQPRRKSSAPKKTTKNDADVEESKPSNVQQLRHARVRNLEKTPEERRQDESTQKRERLVHGLKGERRRSKKYDGHRTKPKGDQPRPKKRDGDPSEYVYPVRPPPAGESHAAKPRRRRHHATENQHVYPAPPPAQDEEAKAEPPLESNKKQRHHHHAERRRTKAAPSKDVRAHTVAQPPAAAKRASGATIVTSKGVYKTSAKTQSTPKTSRKKTQPSG